MVPFINAFTYTNFKQWTSHKDLAALQVIPDDASGHPDLRILDAQLQRHSSARTLIGTFCAACPVSGTMHDTHALARVLHRRGALAIFDFSSAGASVASCHVPCSPPASADTARGAAAEPRPPRLDGIIVAAGALANDHTAAAAVVFRTDAVPDTAGGSGPFRALPAMI